MDITNPEVFAFFFNVYNSTGGYLLKKTKI